MPTTSSVSFIRILSARSPANYRPGGLRRMGAGSAALDDMIEAKPSSKFATYFSLRTERPETHLSRLWRAATMRRMRTRGEGGFAHQP